MKELIIEQKAKAYDEAIEKIKYVMEHGVSPVLNKEDLQGIFPELKESEDEKIRKFLIEDIKDTLSSEDFKHYNPEHTKKLEEALAWLEKQSEKKPQRMISAEAKEAMYDKPAWSEEDEDFMYDTLSNLTELKDRYGEGYGNVGKCIDWLKSLKQRIEGE